MIISKQILPIAIVWVFVTPSFFRLVGDVAEQNPKRERERRKGWGGWRESSLIRSTHPLHPLLFLSFFLFPLLLRLPFCSVLLHSRSIPQCVCVRSYIESENPWAQPLMNSHFPLRQTHSSSTCRRNYSFTEWLTQVNCSPLQKPPSKRKKGNKGFLPRD